ncbi:MAG: hypothetical protein R3E31_28690 [Chloroflexota bacterium]
MPKGDARAVANNLVNCFPRHPFAIHCFACQHAIFVAHANTLPQNARLAIADNCFLVNV